MISCGGGGAASTMIRSSSPVKTSVLSSSAFTHLPDGYSSCRSVSTQNNVYRLPRNTELCHSNLVAKRKRSLFCLMLFTTNTSVHIVNDKRFKNFTWINVSKKLCCFFFFFFDVIKLFLNFLVFQQQVNVVQILWVVIGWHLGNLLESFCCCDGVKVKGSFCEAPLKKKEKKNTSHRLIKCLPLDCNSWNATNKNPMSRSYQKVKWFWPCDLKSLKNYK